MKAIAINGSPRKGWNTDMLLKQALKGASDAGAETELIQLSELTFSGCRSCFACKRAGAEQVTIGVFENNMPAYYCYKAAGFHDVKSEQEVICELFGEKWRILELEISREEYMLLGR